MKRFTILICLIILILPVFSNNQKKDDWPVLKGPYLGQKPPGMTPELFAPFIFSKTQPEWTFSTTFTESGNEFFFSEFNPLKKIDEIKQMKRINNIWTKPEVTSFSGIYSNNDQCMSPDGYSLFFRSRRLSPGSSTLDKYFSLWFVTRTKKGWSKAQPVEFNSDKRLRTGYPSVSSTGTLYFPHKDKNSFGKGDIYRSRLINGSYSAPENLGSPINTKYSEGDLYVTPDESFLTTTCWNRPDNSGESDLYISFRKNDGTWTALTNMGSSINTKHNDSCPYISPDDRYLFFMRVRVENETAMCDTYWVDAKIIEKLKPYKLK